MGKDTTTLQKEIALLQMPLENIAILLTLTMLTMSIGSTATILWKVLTVRYNTVNYRGVLLLKMSLINFVYLLVAKLH